MMRLNTYLLLGCFWFAGCSNEIQKTKSQLSINEPANIYTYSAKQYKGLMESLPENKFPRSFENGELITSNSDWWCSGFYPGTLFHLYEQTGKESLYEEAKDKLELLEKEQYNTNTHDLGFMMFDSFGHAYRINQNNEYKDILINSAKSLSSRYSPTTQTIRSWDSELDDFLVIIDNMMNLDLLFWATEVTGDSTYYDVAVTHANTTIKNHFRADNSSWHVLNYHPETGEIQEKRTAQGLNDESAWARGQAWGLYGFTETYGNTGDQKYLDQALSIADFILNHPNLPEDNIPLWDFDAEPDALRDASAAAIIASALLELDQYVPDTNYRETAEAILKTLTNEYVADLGKNGHFILEHGVGHLPANSEVDVPLTYADYYYIEALTRLD